MDKLIEYNNSKNLGNLVFTLNIYSLKSWFGEMRVVAYCVMLIELRLVNRYYNFPVFVLPFLTKVEICKALI